MTPSRGIVTHVDKLTLVVNEEIPPDLREALQKEAQERNWSLNDVANKILADHYGVEFLHPRTHYRLTAPRFKLRVPERIHRKLREEAASKLQTIRGTALSILAAHFGTTQVSPQRRPRRQAA